MEIRASQSKIEQSIDLAELLGREPNDAEAQAFYNEAIEEIIGRTQEGFDRNGRRFPNYTEEYAEIKGVSRGDVDLTLFGDMLLSIRGERDGSRVNLVIDGDEAAKAFGHISGYEGHPTITNGPKRDFFGLTEGEARSIATNIDSEPVSTPSIPDLFAERQMAVDDILNAIGLEAEIF